jgi:hypothetical protein
MKKIKLLEKLEQLFVGTEGSQAKELEHMASVIEQLQHKLHKTRNSLKHCKNEDYKKVLQLEIEVLSAQIEKGRSFIRQKESENQSESEEQSPK